ncbi:aminotransferase class I/II-fold pyridoxal phosphate-dependent enzyme [Streptomyces sp. SP18CS02]|uniref:aminotransferase class I/II-fold pyridoxal phosphate-dependent enzyme n=1 Tax=Streptomyces sp. SP18CS02 TaxID=3002531 RepID=UPI002E78FCE4|nr:aminotransferase class I/II-fold pyridoxal phosphate-dependent enzyme [Streptomyces sp. SP18CS02]MEE1752074.1 aminotransferase class I/II-fold pyridoxal phosphate-dependent enzyme [Streptomyces sp. SP18CS02]
MAGDVTALFRASTAHSPSIAMLDRAGGGGTGRIIDFCIPCNAHFPTPAMFERLGARLREILTYYPSGADTITGELCQVLGLHPGTVAMGNGSTELITWIDHLLVRESLAVPVPTFGRWTDQPMETGKRVDMFLLPEARGFQLDTDAFVRFIRTRRSRTAVICNPNNPDGGLLSKAEVLSLCDTLHDLDLVVVDESFMEFADAPGEASVVDEAVLRPNVIVLRSLGKNFGLHGIRFGYLVANPALAGRVRSMLPKWNINSFAEAVVFMLKEYRGEYAESLRRARVDRQEMIARLAQLPGLTVYPSQGNFAYVRLPVGVDGTVLRDRLLSEHGVLVRECGNKVGSSSRFLRLVVREQEEVRQLISAMEQVLYGGPARPAPLPAAAPPSPMLPQGLQYVPSPMAAAPLPPSMVLPGSMPPASAAPAMVMPGAMPPAMVMPPSMPPSSAVSPSMPAPMATRVPRASAATAPSATAASTAPATGPMAMARGYTSGTAAVDRLVSGA